jgi:hypothetical protein
MRMQAFYGIRVVLDGDRRKAVSPLYLSPPCSVFYLYSLSFIALYYHLSVKASLSIPKIETVTVYASDYAIKSIDFTAKPPDSVAASQTSTVKPQSSTATSHVSTVKPQGSTAASQASTVKPQTSAVKPQGYKGK